MLAPLFLSAVLAAPPALPAAKVKTQTNQDVMVEAAAREFRLEMYQLFREKRHEFDSRRAMGNELLKAWNRAEQPSGHREAVLAWFDEAKRRSQAGSKLALYARLEDLKSKIAAQESAAVAADLAAGETDDKQPPPFIVDLPKTGEADSSVENLVKRVKALFSGAPPSEPPATPAK